MRRVSCFSESRLYRTSTRTKNVKDYTKETLELKINSNFISHFDTCAGLPKNKNFEAFIEAEECAKHGPVAPTKQAAFSGTTDVDDGDEGTTARSRLVLSKFVASGNENPAIEVTQKGFRELFVRAVIEDDLPFLLGEKPGISRLLTYLLPSHYAIPTRKTVRRDLDLLYSKLNDELNSELKVGESIGQIQIILTLSIV